MRLVYVCMCVTRICMVRSFLFLFCSDVVVWWSGEDVCINSDSIAKKRVASFR